MQLKQIKMWVNNIVKDDEKDIIFQVCLIRIDLDKNTAKRILGIMETTVPFFVINLL